jgi:murein tripeptide amidase MpaA
MRTQQTLFTKPVIATLSAVVIFGVGLSVFVLLKDNTPEVPLENERGILKHEVIGSSVEGRNIEAYTYGNGATHLLFVGGIHGGYEWNSVLLAYEFIDYLDASLKNTPPHLTVTVVPSANPDGVYDVIGTEGRFALSDIPNDASTELGRFNAHGVDLNRNFDCKW